MTKTSGGIASIFILMAVSIGTTYLGCSPTTISWTGSIDAVFKYRTKEKSTLVHKIKPNSLSEQAGLKTGDRLLAVDGQDLTTASYEAVRHALRGPIGTFAVLTVRRGEQLLELKVERLPVKDETEETDERN
ncbi:MAG: PDZ domain-containing protein [Myxococcota bacterium]|nr:PDZ domain-containing protein [Myxococcota bacterium]